MLPAHFLDSPEGKRHLLKKRRERCLRFILDLEPKGYKRSSQEDKKTFSKTIVRKMKELHRKSFRSALALKITIQTSSSNPLPIQRYPKSYIDLLHQTYHRANENSQYLVPADRDRLLMMDDAQIKFLSVDFHVSNTNRLSIRANKLGNLVQDLVFLRDAGDLHLNKSQNFSHGFDPKFNADKSHDLFSAKTSAAIKYMHESDRQNDLLGSTGFQFFMFEILLSGYESFKNPMRNVILNLPNCIKLGHPPLQTRSTDDFIQNIKYAVKVEISRYKLQGPVLHPISCTIIVIQPDTSNYAGNRIDLDNYAFRHILPIVHQELSPHITLTSIHNDTFPFTNKSAFSRKGLPKSVVQYSVIEIPRLEDDPKEGSVFMFLGKATFRDCFWNELDRT